jgi:hypothetical protein
VGTDHLFNLPADRIDRVQRSHGILEDHGDILSANIPHFFSISLQFMDLNISPLIPAVIDNFPFLNPGKLGKQLHDGSSRHTLAAAGLSYNAECLAAFNVHGNTIDRPVAALIRIEIRL